MLPVDNEGRIYTDVQKGLDETGTFSYGSLSQALYALFPHKHACQKIGAVLEDITEVLKPLCNPTEFDGAQFVFSGSLGKMWVAGYVPAGYFSPLYMTRKIIARYPQLKDTPEVSVSSSRSIDADLRFRLKKGAKLFDMVPQIEQLIASHNLYLDTTINQTEVGLFQAISIKLSDDWRIDLAGMPNSWGEAANNFRMSPVMSSKDAHCVARYIDRQVWVDSFSRRLLFGPDISIGFNQADMPKALIAGLRAILTDYFFPPTSDEIIGGVSIWEDMKTPRFWERRRDHGNMSTDGSGMRTRQSEVGRLLWLILICQPTALAQMYEYGMVQQVRLGDELDDKNIVEFINRLNPNYQSLLQSGRLEVEQSGPAVLATTLGLSLPRLPETFKLHW